MRLDEMRATLVVEGGIEMPDATSLAESSRQPFKAASTRTREKCRPAKPRRQPLVVYTIDVHSLHGQPFGRETFALREDAERFLEEIGGHDPGVASSLWIEERDIVAA